MCKYSKLNLNTFALSCKLVHTQLTVTVQQRAAMQQLSAKVFKLSFSTLLYPSPIQLGYLGALSSPADTGGPADERILTKMISFHGMHFCTNFCLRRLQKIVIIKSIR